MDETNTALLYTFSILMAIIIFVILIAYNDGVSFGLIRKIMCKFDRHTTYRWINFKKKQTYYCQVCKKPRTHPLLKVVDGKDKKSDNHYKF